MMSRPFRPLAHASVRPEAGRVRLDLVTNPFGPSPLVPETLAAELMSPPTRKSLTVDLTERLTRRLGVPAASLFLANGVESILRALYLSQRDIGPVILFPPSDPVDVQRADMFGVETISINRGPSFRPSIDTEVATDLPSTGMALITSPNDPTGTLAGSQDVVRLARACRLVVIDERHGGYQPHSLLPLAREFDNVVVLQSFETWAGLYAIPFAYAVGASIIMNQLRTFSAPNEPSVAAMLSARATLEDHAHVEATVRRVRLERSRLFRTLRKLNMVTPYPSWSNFLLARIERGDRAGIDRGLRERGISVHLPAHPELAQFLRISATRPEEMDVLKVALIEIGRDLP